MRPNSHRPRKSLRITILGRTLAERSIVVLPVGSALAQRTGIRTSGANLNVFADGNFLGAA